jgi:DNA-binding CsgD family transcriptional regulator
MITESLSCMVVYFLLLPAAALEILFIVVRHGKNAHPLYFAAFLIPFINLVADMFQANPATDYLYIGFYVLGEVIVTAVPWPIIVKVVGKKPPILVSISLLALCAAYFILLPFELVGRNIGIAAWRNGLRFIITWFVCIYLLARLRHIDAGVPRTAVFLYGVQCLMNIPFILIARTYGRMTGTRTAPVFFSYDQRTVDYMIGYALFNIVIAFLFIFMRPRPVLSAVRESAFDPEELKELLSKREREIAMLLCQGQSYNQIAGRLFISKHTVRNHCHSIFEKCRVRSRFELTHVLGSLLSGEQPERSEDKPFIIEK